MTWRYQELCCYFLQISSWYYHIFLVSNRKLTQTNTLRRYFCNTTNTYFDFSWHFWASWLHIWVNQHNHYQWRLNIYYHWLQSSVPNKWSFLLCSCHIAHSNWCKRGNLIHNEYWKFWKLGLFFHIKYLLFCTP